MNRTKIAKEILRIATQILAADGDADEGFDESTLKGLVSDLDKAGDKVESVSDDLADQAKQINENAEELLDENGTNASAFYQNRIYASMYYSKHMVAGKQYYKANALAEECRVAAVKIAKYLKKASQLRVALGEGMGESYEKSKKEWYDKTTKLLTDVKNRIKQVIDYLVQKIKAFINYVKDICTKAKDAGKEALGFMAKAGLTAAIVAIIAIITPVALAVWGIVKVYGVTKDAILSVFDKVKTAFEALKKAIAGKIDDILNALASIAGAVEGITTGVIDVVTGAVEKKKDEVENELE